MDVSKKPNRRRTPLPNNTRHYFNYIERSTIFLLISIDLSLAENDLRTRRTRLRIPLA